MQQKRDNNAHLHGQNPTVTSEEMYLAVQEEMQIMEEAARATGVRHRGVERFRQDEQAFHSGAYMANSAGVSTCGCKYRL